MSLKTTLRFLPVLAWTVSVCFFPSRAAAENDRLLTIVEAEGLGGYSEIIDHDGTSSSLDRWLVSPSVKIDDRTTWINLYNGDFNRSAQVVAVEEGGRRTTTTQSHHLSTGLRHEVNDTWAVRPIFFADWIFVNETEDEDFSEGLYDYRDIGGGLESSWIKVKTKDREDDLRLGFRFLDREYPNYQSLLSLFNPNGSIETNEKDLQGYKANLGYRSRSRDDWSWGLEGIFFYKDYTDKKVIDANGIRLSDTREDFSEYVNAFFSHPLNAEWTFGLDGQFIHSDSNLDFYDTHNTLALGDDDHIGDYFDFYSFTVKPSFTYTRMMGEDKKLQFTADYAFSFLRYPGRPAQNTAGRYLTEDQEDRTHSVSGRLSVPLNKHISWVAFGSYTVAESNQEFESFYLYEYDLWTAVTGFSFKY